MRLVVYQGAREWSAEEVLARLGLGQDVTIEQVTARVLERGLKVTAPIGTWDDMMGTLDERAVVVRLPAEQPPPPHLLESRMRTAEARIVELERMVAELQQHRSDEAGRADRAEANLRRRAS